MSGNSPAFARKIAIADVVRVVERTIFEKPGEAKSPKNSPCKELILRCWNTLSNIIVVQLEQITFERPIKRFKE